jgi:fatty-acyl-CoA synthase
VRYTHRSNFLHSFIVNLPDALGMGANNTVLMIVPAFHANSWGMNFAGIAAIYNCRLSNS